MISELRQSFFRPGVNRALLLCAWSALLFLGGCSRPPTAFASSELPPKKAEQGQPIHLDAVEMLADESIEVHKRLIRQFFLGLAVGDVETTLEVASSDATARAGTSRSTVPLRVAVEKWKAQPAFDPSPPAPNQPIPRGIVPLSFQIRSVERRGSRRIISVETHTETGRDTWSFVTEQLPPWKVVEVFAPEP